MKRHVRIILARPGSYHALDSPQYPVLRLWRDLAPHGSEDPRRDRRLPFFLVQADAENFLQLALVAQRQVPPAFPVRHSAPVDADFRRQLVLSHAENLASLPDAVTNRGHGVIIAS